MLIANLLAKQFRRPTGLLGLYAQRFMLKNNAGKIEWAIKMSDIQENDMVLEIGFGPGIGIKMAAVLASRGKIFGLDFSPGMVKKAAGYNKALIDAGRVELKFGDMNPAPFPDAFFDKILAINVVYFWPEPAKELSEIARMLKPGGKAVVYLTDRLSMDSVSYTNTGVFRKYTAEEFLPVIKNCSFSHVSYETSVQMSNHREIIGYCFVAVK